MAAPRILPSDSQLGRWREAGLSLNQICDRIETETGIRPARSSIGAALSKAGLTNPVRYDEYIPWKVRAEHRSAYQLYQLRVAARLDRGLPVRDGDKERLDRWIAELDELNAVVDYDPTTPEGFLYRRRRSGERLIRVPQTVKNKENSKKAS